MSSRKRSGETDMLIKTASGELFSAESFVLRSFSASARGLPAAADVWDVSGLLLDGAPFSSETVSCWLRCANSNVHGLAELVTEDIRQLSTVDELTQVLAFADAVGSSDDRQCRSASHSMQSDQGLEVQFAVDGTPGRSGAACGWLPLLD